MQKDNRLELNEQELRVYTIIEDWVTWFYDHNCMPLLYESYIAAKNKKKDINIGITTPELP